MQWKIKDIPDDGLDVQLALPEELVADALQPSDGDAAASQLRTELQLFRQGDEILVRGRLHGDVRLSCSACLQPAKIEVEAPVELLYTPPGVVPELDADDPLAEIDVAHHDNQVVDVTEALRELLIVSLPMAPRCSETCKGLCPECGQNLNEAACKHALTKKTGAAPVRAEGKLAEQLRALGLASEKQKN